MAEAGPGLSFSLVAAEPIEQFLAVRLCSDGVVVSTSAAGEGVVGIAQDNAQPGQAVSVQFAGVSRAQAGGLYDVGELLCADSDGKLVALRSSYFAYSIDIAVAVAITAATSLEAITYILLCVKPQPIYLSGTGGTGAAADWWQRDGENPYGLGAKGVTSK